MSAAPLDDLAAILHPPLRLQIAAILAQVTDIEFARLRELTQVSDSVLSKQLAILVDGGLVATRKAALGGRQRTWASLTRDGRQIYAAHLRALQALVKAAEAAAVK